MVSSQLDMASALSLDLTIFLLGWLVDMLSWLLYFPPFLALHPGVFSRWIGGRHFRGEPNVKGTGASAKDTRAERRAKARRRRREDKKQRRLCKVSVALSGARMTSLEQEVAALVWHCVLRCFLVWTSVALVVVLLRIMYFALLVAAWSSSAMFG